MGNFGELAVSIQLNNAQLNQELGDKYNTKRFIERALFVSVAVNLVKPQSHDARLLSCLLGKYECTVPYYS